MWLSRVGVIEQAVSDGAPTIASATIEAGTSNTINIVTSENCTFATTTGITVFTDSADALSVTGISGSDAAGAITLNRNVLGTETVTLTFAATNGITSVASSLSIAAGTTAVTNNVPPPPTVTSAIINSGTETTINFVTSENCNFTDTTGITALSVGGSSITVTGISGSDNAGAVTLSRQIISTETIRLVFAATNGVTSVATGLMISEIVANVTNNSPLTATAPQFRNFTWSSASAATSVTSSEDGTSAVFPAQASGLHVQFPNWVGYGATGAAVTDTSIKLNTKGFETGFTAGAALTAFTCTFINNQTSGAEGQGFQESGVPYFTGEPNGLVQGTNTLGSSITTNTTDAVDQIYTLTSAQFGTSGSGTGATILVKISGNTATGASVALTGTGYAINDTITIPKSVIGGNTDVVITLAAEDISSLSSRTVSLTADQLSLIGLPTITSSGKLSGLVEFDILSLLTTALGTTTTLQYTDAIPASNVTGSAQMGSQISSFFLRVAVNGVDDAGQAWSQELDVRTSEQNPYPLGSPGNVSGPITATPQITSMFIHQANNPNNVIGQVATAANGWNLGTITSADWNSLGGATYDSAQLRAVFQANSYVYNNPVPAEVGFQPTQLVFQDVNFTFTPSPTNPITFAEEQTLVNLNAGTVPGSVISPGPATTPPYVPPEATVSPANVDGGFSVILSNLIGGDDSMLTLATLQGSSPGNYPITLDVTDVGGGVDVFAYNYQIGGDNTRDTTAISPTPFTVSGTYQIV